MNDFFNQKDLLEAYSQILPKSEHYKDILEIHSRKLEGCKNIIDLGCGCGVHAMKILKDGKCVTGVDVSEASIEHLREDALSVGLSDNLVAIVGDITKLESFEDSSFEGASSMIAAHLLERYEEHVKEAYRVLEPGGVFIITARTAGGDQERLVEILKDSLISSGEYEKYKDDFQFLANELLRTANSRSKSLMSVNSAIEILRKAGFVGIEEIQNKTQGVMYSLFAKKV